VSDRCITFKVDLYSLFDFIHAFKRLYHACKHNLLLEQSPSWKADSSSCSLEISRLSWNRMVQHRVHKSPPPVPILSHMNPIHNPPPPPSCLPKIQAPWNSAGNRFFYILLTLFLPLLYPFRTLPVFLLSPVFLSHPSTSESPRHLSPYFALPASMKLAFVLRRLLATPGETYADLDFRLSIILIILKCRSYMTQRPCLPY
jgi:hypothetical protein